MDIVEALQAEGLPLTLKTFQAYLYRQRRRQPVAVEQTAPPGIAFLSPGTCGAMPNSLSTRSCAIPYFIVKRRTNHDRRCDQFFRQRR